MGNWPDGWLTVSRWCGVARWDPGAAVPFPTAARSDGVEAIAGELLAAVALLLPEETKKQPEFREERGRKKKGEGDEEGEGARCAPGVLLVVGRSEERRVGKEC